MAQVISFTKEKKARHELVKWGKELYDQGLVKGSGGNLSIRLDENTILFTPTGCFLGHMTEKHISKTDMNGNMLNAFKPTKEVPLHINIYRVRPNVRAVCHTHSVYATAYASSVEEGTVMPAYTPSVVSKVGQVLVTPYAPPGSEELGEIVRRSILNSNAVFLSNHGLVAVGKTMECAISVANEVENNAMLYFISHGAVRPLGDDEVIELGKKLFL